MRFRLTTDCAAGQTTIRVDGELIGDAIAELVRVCGETPWPVTLDLTNLERVDSTGLELLRSLQSRGTPLAGLSPYVDMLLQQRPESV